MRLGRLGAAFLVLAVAGFFGIAPTTGPARADTAMSGPMTVAPDSLYKKLGGYDALAAVTDDFIGRLATDQRLTKFFVGVSDAHRGIIRQRVLDLLCAKTGGPCIYTGQDMKTVHAGLGISEADWQASVDDFGMTAKKFNIPADLLSQIVALLNSVKPDIVTRQ